MNIAQVLIILLIAFGVIVALIPLYIDDMEIISAILSLVLFMLVIPLLYYSRRKNAKSNLNT